MQTKHRFVAAGDHVEARDNVRESDDGGEKQTGASGDSISYVRRLAISPLQSPFRFHAAKEKKKAS